MMNEFEAPPDWSQWTASRFQQNVAATIVACATYSFIFSMDERNQGFAFVVVTSMLGLLVLSVVLEHHEDKKNGKDPHPDAPRIRNRLPYKPYEEDHEKINDDVEAMKLNTTWDELAKHLPQCLP